MIPTITVAFTPEELWHVLTQRESGIPSPIPRCQLEPADETPIVEPIDSTCRTIQATSPCAVICPTEPSARLQLGDGASRRAS